MECLFYGPHKTSGNVTLVVAITLFISDGVSIEPLKKTGVNDELRLKIPCPSIELS